MENKETNKKVREQEEKLDKESIEKKDVESEVKTNSEKTSTKESAKSTSKKGKKKPENKKDKEIRELKERLDEVSDKYLRLSAEFDNFRKRTLKEKMELSKSAGKQIFENLLPVIDDMERAQQSMEKAEDVSAVKEGLELILSKFTGFMKQQGVTAMNSMGQEFNTDEHEAITKIPAPSEDMKGKVVDVISKGYKINDQILRYSKVVVGE